MQQVLAAVQGVVVGAAARGGWSADRLVVVEGTLQDAFAAGQAGQALGQPVGPGGRDEAFDDAPIAGDPLG